VLPVSVEGVDSVLLGGGALALVSELLLLLLSLPQPAATSAPAASATSSGVSFAFIGPPFRGLFMT
jgi:hypothetical protein